MTEQELRDLPASPENEVVECKPGIPSRREIAEYAVGIGNAGGGRLIMGVSDRVQRVGKAKPYQVKQLLQLAERHNLSLGGEE